MNQERLLKVILSPHISEKATIGTEKNNEYVFQVMKCATKPEVKDAIEFIFNTKVKCVRIVNVRPKAKTFRGIQGARKGWKKAYVTLQADQKLEVAGAQ
ncbi:MAG: Ribosomal protein L23 [uncultured bacterium]|nr:MAG: Ribosomal protein L23 [uncultured bacterium]